jgi:glutaredoxin
MALVVYSRDNCPQCKFTKEFLKKHDIPFETVNVEVQDGALEILRHYGWQSLPVVSIDDELSDQTKTWFGFRPDRLESLL